jgi:hypothetical protein
MDKAHSYGIYIGCFHVVATIPHGYETTLERLLMKTFPPTRRITRNRVRVVELTYLCTETISVVQIIVPLEDANKLRQFVIISIYNGATIDACAGAPGNLRHERWVFPDFFHTPYTKEQLEGAVDAKRNHFYEIMTQQLGCLPSD